MDLRVLVARTPSEVGDSRITVLRMDPEHWDLELAGASLSGETVGRSAREWCERSELVACTNAGMFATDHSTHVGYLRFREHTNSSRVNDYQSVAAFDPRGVGSSDQTLPRFRIFDLDAPGVTMAGILDDYASAVQNLRLVKRPGSNRWSRQEKRWSEAALGEDAAGRILFVFTRSPFSMHDLVRELLAADIGLVSAQHLEGGPEAQLFIGVGEEPREMFGSYETAFREDDTNDQTWPVPNVLGVRPRSPAARAAVADRAPPPPPHR
jgi:hypothetical protein